MKHRLTRHPVRTMVWFFVFVLVAGLALPAAPAWAQTSITLSVPSNVLVAPGQDIVIPVTLTSTAAGAAAADVAIAFESSKLTVVSIDPGAATNNAEWMLVPNTTQPGVAAFSMATAGLQGLPAGSSEIARITLHAAAATTGPVSLTFTVYMVDEQNATITNGSVRINTPPVAVADTYSTPEDTQLVVTEPGVLTNDSDFDTDARTAVLVATTTKGALALAANGSFTYTPNSNTNGVDTFSYKANDGKQDGNTVTVTINVGAANDPPVVNIGGPYSVNEGGSVVLNGAATDPEGDALTFAWDLDNNGVYETPGSNPPFSAATRDGDGTQLVHLRVTDQPGLFTIADATITINNVAPTARAGGPYSVDEGGTVVLNGSASTDPAGPDLDPLTYAWNFADGGSTTDSNLVNPTFSAAGITGPANRTVTLTVNDGDGGTDSATANVTIRDVVALDMPELRARLGEPVQFYVDLSGLNSSLSVIDLTITYPSGALTFNSAAPTGLTSSWTVAPPSATAGQVILHMTGATPLSATSGRVVLLNFTSSSSEGATDALTISAASINGGAVSATRTTGSIYLLKRYTIAGNVTYWSAAKAVLGAALALTGDDQHDTTTAAAGAYNIVQVYEGNQTLTPSKSDQVNGITAYDAAFVLRHSAHLITLSGNALAVADVTGNSVVDASDATLILRHSVGLTQYTYPAQGAVWRFDPATRPYTPLATNQSAQNFTALLMGDVSGSWNPAGVTTAAWPASVESGEPLPLVLTVARTGPTTALLTITLVNAPSDILSMDMEVALSSAAGTPRATAAQQVMVATSMPSARTLRVGIATTTALKNGTVATIELTTPANTANTTVTAEVVSLMINERVVRSQSNALFLPVIGR